MNSNHSNQRVVLQEGNDDGGGGGDGNFTGTDRVAKLIEERDTLLQTGVYTMDDIVISELDKEIRQMIASNG